MSLPDVFATEKFLLSLSGFYPLRTNPHPLLSFCSACVNTLVSSLQVLSMIGQMVVDRHDISKLTDTLLFFMTNFTYICKLANFQFYKKHLLTLEDQLLDPIYWGFPPEKLNILETKVGVCKRVATTFRALCVLCIIFYSIVPLLEEGKQLPLPGWVPYDAEKFYYSTVLFQIASVCTTAYNNSSIDTLTWKLITIAAGELAILRENLENLDSGFEKCVRHHNAILKLIHKIQFIFSKGIFVQFLASVVIICFTGFQLIVVPIPSRQFVFLVMYFVCMLCEVAMYCWYGHEVMTISDKLGRHCYMSDWYESDITIQKNVVVFLERTKKPITLTAGNFVTLSLETLTGILRSAYSYFAVLQRLYEGS